MVVSQEPFKCTLILATNGARKPAFLASSLAYYRRAPADIQVILCFSGTKEVFEREYESGIAGSEIVVRLTPGVRYERKILDALVDIRSPFVALCADDDFTLMPSVLGAVEALQCPDMNAGSVMGRIYSYHQEQPNVLQDASGNLRTINHPDAKQRAEDLMASYFPTYYAVQRKEILEAALSSYESLEGEYGLNFLEVFIGLACASYGPILCIDTPFQFRDSTLSSGQHHKQVYRQNISNALLQAISEMLSSINREGAQFKDRDALDLLTIYRHQVTLKQKIYARLPRHIKNLLYHRKKKAQILSHGITLPNPELESEWNFICNLIREKRTTLTKAE